MVDFAKMEVTRDGKPVTLTAHEFKTLRFFSENPERVLSRDELLNQVWGYEVLSFDTYSGQPYSQAAAEAEEGPREPLALPHHPPGGLQVRTFCESRRGGMTPADAASTQAV